MADQDFPPRPPSYTVVVHRSDGGYSMREKCHPKPGGNSGMPGNIALLAHGPIGCQLVSPQTAQRH